ncbi:terminase [Bacillus idriensis]|uniref:Terminase n=1 Tax=Metabacillus idriensis TaxID=324768 RepID=A0A6I2MEH2_9BACI|nr:terminase small subunit [Metabacillus idriensis]MRX54831.1 terminase [Metabacillus idriensis]
MNWDEIKSEFESTNVTLKALAEKHDIKLGTLKSRKSRDGWSRDATKKDATIKKKVATPKEKDASKNDHVIEAEELTEKQRLFCLYYVKSFNATQSAINAGYATMSAHVEGSRLLKNDKVSVEIRRIKQSMTDELYIEAMDVLSKYVKIAFSNITDFLTFGQKEVEVMGPFGPVKDENGNQIWKEVNYVDFKDSGFVDGTIISEVKQGKDGVSIKLEDRMKAMEKLSLYFDLFPDKFKRQIEEEKLKLAQAKIHKEVDEQEKDVAAALRGLVNGINTQTD